MPAATAYVKRAGPGGSAAALVDCDDQILRVIKVIGNPQQNQVLINELIVGRLADLLGAPCPPSDIVDVPQLVLDDAMRDIPELKNALPGPAFGCEYISGKYEPGPDICANAANRDDLIQLVGLYQWVRNHDMKPSHLLYSIDSSGRAFICGFDHGHCIGNPGWDASQVADWPTKPHKLKASVVDGAIDPTDVDRFESRVMAVSDSQIEGATSKIPTEWGGVDADLRGLAQSLSGSRAGAVGELRTRYV